MLTSRSILFIALLAAPALANVMTPHPAMAAPTTQPLLGVVVSQASPAIEPVYYYRGRYYRYRYNGRYYAHRSYRAGRWRYY